MDTPASDTLHTHRRAIDSIDQQLLALINQRAGHARAIGGIKLTDGAAGLYDPAREAKLLRALCKANKGPCKEAHLRAIYREIISACLDLEQQQTIAYLGPEGTFTHTAALRHFGSSAHYTYRTSILDVFDALDRDECNYAVVPIENSTEGAVSHTMDMLSERKLLIIGELEVPVQHCLLGHSGMNFADIQKVHAHEQALSQCGHWLRQNVPHANLHKEPSNGLAVQKALHGTNLVAVGAEINARIYNLDILAKNIEDVRGNKTRFVVLGKTLANPTGRDKTALVFVVRHKPGSLYRALGCFARLDIDLTRLESRPLKNADWSYGFFAELRGHITDAKVDQAIREMDAECSMVKFLGSYPSAD